MQQKSLPQSKIWLRAAALCVTRDTSARTRKGITEIEINKSTDFVSKGSAPVTSGKQLRFTDRRRASHECGMSLSLCPVARRTRCPLSVSGWMRVSLATMRLARRVSSATQLDICQIACIFRWCWCHRCCRRYISPKLSPKRAKHKHKISQKEAVAEPTRHCNAL